MSERNEIVLRDRNGNVVLLHGCELFMAVPDQPYVITEEFDFPRIDVSTPLLAGRPDLEDLVRAKGLRREWLRTDERFLGRRVFRERITW